MGTRHVSLAARGLLGAALLAALPACDPPTPQEIERKTEGLVQFGNAVTTFGDTDGGSETAILVNQKFARKVVAFNFDDHVHVTFPSNSRKVCPGASLMGWGFAATGVGSTFSRGRV